MSGGIRKGEDISLSIWRDFITPIPSVKPKGYSTAQEIADKLEISNTTVRHKLSILRKDKKIDCMQIKDGRNITWVYKD